MEKFFAVAVGGSLGALLRYALAHLGNQGEFPLGTLIANSLGCFLIGVGIVVLKSTPEPMRLLLVTGGLGALTTMSTFSFEVIALVNDSRWLHAASYWALTNILAIGFCAGGYWLSLRMFS